MMLTHSSRYGSTVLAAAIFFVNLISLVDAASFEGIGGLPGIPLNSYASSVSADGSTVIGVSATPNGFMEAFRWTAATGMVGLGDLPGGNPNTPFGSFFSEAMGISGDGMTVVGQ